MTAHWDALGGDYEQEWEAPARRALSAAELGFVTAHLDGSPAGRALDVGIGSGRILAAVLGSPRVTEVVGMDASSAMVAHCRARFAGDPRLASVVVGDAADGPLDGERFDFVSAIRVLKYEAAWADAVGRLAASLTPGGVLVFSMPNRRSLNVVSRSYAVPWHTTTVGELRALAHRFGLVPVAITAFTKLPHAAYLRPRRAGVARVPVAVDRALGWVLGDRRFGRELFVALRAPA